MRTAGFIAVVLGLALCFAHNARAQYVEISTGGPANEKAKDSVIKPQPIFSIEELFSQSPDLYFEPFLDTLLGKKKYKDAEKLVKEKIKTSNQSLPAKLYIDLGRVYKGAGKSQKAKDQYDKAVMYINGDDMLTRDICQYFEKFGEDDYSLQCFMKGGYMLQNPYFYNSDIARLYAKSGHLDTAFEVLMSYMPGMPMNVEQVKTSLLKLVGNDPDKLRQLQKMMITKINEHPEQLVYEEILTWIYTQKNDWDGALMQIEAIDLRNNEDGRRLLDFARLALNEKQYAASDKAFGDVIAKGQDKNLYLTAKAEQLSEAYTHLKNQPEDTSLGIIDTLDERFSSFLALYPSYNPALVGSDYAEFEAKYMHNPAKSVAILNKIVYRNDIQRDQVGKLKLQMGDYYLLEGKIWDASLTYSQVDKEFRQDAMGEDARFRNAKLAYYRGDFKWAQQQLMILKSATSELISNDAIALSVLITENIEDSFSTPLLRFAHADLLLAQNRDQEGLDSLDSIAAEFPKHPLNDDILMRHAQVEEKHRHYDKAIAYLERIHNEYGTDVLADDAMFEIATIYQNYLHNTEKAKEYFENLILEYPGSTFVQSARQHLYDMKNGATP